MEKQGKKLTKKAVQGYNKYVWTEQEKKSLIQLKWSNNYTWSQIAEKMGRTNDACERKYRDMRSNGDQYSLIQKYNIQVKKKPMAYKPIYLKNQQVIPESSAIKILQQLTKINYSYRKVWNIEMDVKLLYLRNQKHLKWKEIAKQLDLSSEISCETQYFNLKQKINDVQQQKQQIFVSENQQKEENEAQVEQGKKKYGKYSYQFFVQVNEESVKIKKQYIHTIIKTIENSLKKIKRIKIIEQNNNKNTLKVFVEAKQKIFQMFFGLDFEPEVVCLDSIQIYE